MTRTKVRSGTCAIVTTVSVRPTADIMLNAQRTLNPMEAAIPPRIASVDEQMGDFAAFPPLPGCSDTQSFFLSDFKT